MKCIENEIPFEVPEGWEWDRLSNIASFSGGKTPSTSNPIFWNGNILWVTSKDMKSKYIESSQLLLSDEGALHMQLYPIDTVLLVVRSGILRHTLPIAILKKEATINQDIKAISLYDHGLSEWLYSCLKGMENAKLLKYTKSGTTVENINFDEFKQLLLPIPSIDEIERILIQIQSTIEKTDTIESSKIDLSELIDQTKSKILDLAIQGKLVPQDPNDEPASVLLKRIRTEKETLIKQGKLKRDKKESVIYKGGDSSYYEKLFDGTVKCIDEELPFDIPLSWSWERVRNLFIVNPKNTVDDNVPVSFIPMALLDDGYSGGYTYEEKKWKECKKGFTHFADGDVCFAKISPCFENRKSACFQNLRNGYGTGTTELYVLRRYTDDIMPEYLLSFVKSEYFISRGRNTFSGVVGQQRVDKEVMLDTFIPIPPIAEQAQISGTLSNAFSEISNIEDGIN